MANGTAPIASPIKVPVHANGDAHGTSANLDKPNKGKGTASKPKRELPRWTRREIAERICAGSSLVLRGDLVLNVTTWGAYHPGGALSLAHFVGRDAADEIAAYHSDSTLERMKSFAVARVDPVDFTEKRGWAPLTPPISLGLVRHPDGVKGHWVREGQIRLTTEVVDGKTDADRGVDTVNTGERHDEVVTLTPDMLEPLDAPDLDREIEHVRSKAYHSLKKRVTDAGLFKPPGPLAGYGKDAIRYSLLMGSALALFFTSTGWAGQMVSAVLLGLCWQQLTCKSPRTVHYVAFADSSPCSRRRTYQRYWQLVVGPHARHDSRRLDRRPVCRVVV